MTREEFEKLYPDHEYADIYVNPEEFDKAIYYVPPFDYVFKKNNT